MDWGLGMIRVFPGTDLYKHAVKENIIKDEVQFIKDGCLLTNVSKLSADEYKKLYDKITLLMGGDNEPLNIQNIQIDFPNNKYDFDGECVECHKISKWEVKDIFNIKERLRCKHCGKYHTIPVISEIDEKFFLNFMPILQKSNKIAFWGMGRYFVERIGINDVIIKSKNIFLIDESITKQGCNQDGKKVYSPQILKEENIDIIIVAVPYLFNDIIYQIRRKYKFSKKVINITDFIK